MRVVVEQRDRVLVVRMDRTDKRNAVDAAMTAGMSAALDRLEDDDDLWVGVLTGGPGVFSAGTDLIAGSGEPTPRGGSYGVVRRARRKPLIAAVEGLALGGGMEMVLACDLVVAGRGAAFGLPEVARGVVPLCGGLFRAPRALPLNVARELLLTGDRLGAERAERLGFVNVLTDDGGAVEAAVALAERIAATPRSRCVRAWSPPRRPLPATTTSAGARRTARWRRSRTRRTGRRGWPRSPPSATRCGGPADARGPIPPIRRLRDRRSGVTASSHRRFLWCTPTPCRRRAALEGSP